MVHTTYHVNLHEQAVILICVGGQSAKGVLRGVPKCVPRGTGWHGVPSTILSTDACPRSISPCNFEPETYRGARMPL